MQDISKLCMVCLSVKDDNNICPRCKRNHNVVQNSPLLPLRSIINGRYCIGQYVKKNGEGYTYGAYDLTLDKAVSIREFFPENMASRGHDGLEVVPYAGSENDFSGCRADFIAMWSTLKRLCGMTALITVTDVFQLNSTAYAVYDESERVTLQAFLESRASSRLLWSQAKKYFLPVLNCLDSLHASGVCHCGINPASFVFSTDGKSMKLTGFSINDTRICGGNIQPVEIFDGYAPPEQHEFGFVPDSSADIYSFSAVLYRTLTGSEYDGNYGSVPGAVTDAIPLNVADAIKKGLSEDPSDRARDCASIREMLLNSIAGGDKTLPIYHNAAPEKYVSEEIIEEKPYVRSAPVHIADEKYAEALEPEDDGGQTKTVMPDDDFVRVGLPDRDERERLRKKQTERLQEESGQAERDTSGGKQGGGKRALLKAAAVIFALIMLGCCVFVVHEMIGLKKETDTPTTTEAQEIPVPDFEGMDIEDIKLNKEYTDNFVFDEEPENNSEVTEGIVIRQSVEKGTVVPVGTHIMLAVSEGPAVKKIPDVIGKDYAAAESELLEAGFKCVRSGSANDGSHKAGTVRELIPGADEEAEEGTEITVVVWLDAVPEETAAVIDLGSVETEAAVEDEPAEEDAEVG